jgi:two-component system cell cycle response regulator DivK
MPFGQSKRFVLVVEDDRRLRDLYRSALTDAGFTVVAVEDGSDALGVLETRVPAAVVLDLALPRVRGLDVAQELKASAITRHVPIVVVTGTDGRDIQDLDVECVLRKPVLSERLVETVHRCMQKASAV